MNPVNAYSDRTVLSLVTPGLFTKHAGELVGSIVDTKPYKGIAALQFHHSGIYDTDTSKAPSLALKLQTCATTGGSYADVTGAAFTAVTATAGDTSGTPALESLPLNLAACKRYVRVYKTLATATANNPKITGGVVFIAPATAT